MEGKPWFDALFDTTNGIDIINASDEKVAYNPHFNLTCCHFPKR
jgi:hypothetical protein